MSDNLADVKADLKAVADADGDVLCRAALREIEELEAKLAKAVEALETIAGPHNWASPHAGLGGSMDDDLRIVARTTLAELTGGKDD